MNRRLSRFLAVFSVCTTMAVPASAADHWGIMDPLGKENTSPCIGDPKTPICVIETVLYCTASSSIDLCERVGFNYRRIWGQSVREYQAKLYYALYREVARRPTTPADRILDYKDRLVYRGRKGDVAVRLELQNCEPDRACLRRDKRPITGPP